MNQVNMQLKWIDSAIEFMESHDMYTCILIQGIAFQDHFFARNRGDAPATLVRWTPVMEIMNLIDRFLEKLSNSKDVSTMETAVQLHYYPKEFDLHEQETIVHKMRCTMLNEIKAHLLTKIEGN